MNTNTAAFPSGLSLPALSDATDGVTFTMLGTTMRLIATGNETDGRYTLLEQVTPAGWGPPRHIHAHEDEIVYVLEGTYEVTLGDEHRTISVGGCAVLPRDVPHGFRNVGSEAGRFLCLVAPSGLEQYFLALSQCSEPLTTARLIQMAKPYGLTLLPPGA
jgi:quercetin dioxygenase-like cupin family protein